MNTQIHRRKASEQFHPLEGVIEKSLVFLNFIICIFAFYFMWKIAAFWRPFAVAILVIPIYFLSKIAWKAGRMFRDFTMPSAYITNGVKDSFNKRIFWIAGPQSIAAFWAIIIAWYLGFMALSPESKIRTIASPELAMTSASPGVSLTESGNTGKPREQSASENLIFPNEAMINQPDSTRNSDSFSNMAATNGSQIGPSGDVPTAALLTGKAGNLNGSSFDCQKVASTQENLICSNANLAELDAQMAAEYEIQFAVTTDRNGLKESQVNWLNSTRKVCESIECLTTVYEDRIAKLRVMEW